VGILLALLAALCYGSSDFAAGLGGRRGDPAAVAVVAQPFGLMAAVIAVVVLAGRSPSASGLWWGALSGVGGAVGTVSLYRGLTVASMTGVLGGVANLAYLAATGAAPLAVVAVVTALYPAMTVLLARFTLHERWSRLQAIGLLISAAAVAAVSAG
jgi:uncharacterized membrane protein